MRSFLPLAIFLTFTLPACGGAAGMQSSRVSIAGTPTEPEVATVQSAPGDRLSLEGGKSEASAERLVVRNASVSLEVGDEKEIDKALSKLRDIPKSFSGFVANETSRSITLRVPTKRVDEVVDHVGRIGKVVHRDLHADDVTMRHQDLRIRLDNAKKLLTRYQKILEAATGVADMLAIEKEVARVTGEIERMEGEFRLLDSQVRLATIEISLDTKTTPGPIGWVFYGAYTGVKWLFVWD